MSQKQLHLITLIILISLFGAHRAYAKYHLLEMFVSPTGSLKAKGTKNDPIPSLQEAQKHADRFIGKLKPNGIHKNDYIKVRINLSGSFTCQTFQWKHSYKSVHLHIRSTPGQTAELNGHRQGCYNSGPKGLTFFAAYGLSSELKSYKGFTGYGSIAIHSLVVKHYGTAINITAWEDIKPGLISVKHNVFYNIGQIVDPSQWEPTYSIIYLKNIDGVEVIDNRFVQIGNTVKTSLMHAIYFIRSDRGIVKDNHFESISGPPIKFRDSSDKNTVIGNTFIRGENSTHRFPIQNWYDKWWLTDAQAGSERELPSFDNRLENNKYLNGYIDYPINHDYELRKSIRVNRIVATPDILPQSYSDAAAFQGTNNRFVVQGRSVYGVHWVQLKCNEFNAFTPDDL